MYIDYDTLIKDENLHTLPRTNGRAAGSIVIFLDDIEKIAKDGKSSTNAVITLETESGETYHLTIGPFETSIEAEKAARVFNKKYCSGFDFKATCKGFQILEGLR